MSLIHVTIHVSDIGRSISFYRDDLGLQVVNSFESRGKRIAMLGNPKGALLEIIDDGKGDVDCPDVSIGFSVTNAARLARKLDPQCIGPISPDPSIVFFIIRDPDGHRIQLLEHLDG
ncbi:MAG: VOC family protein [Candidatus Methanomethylophilaceae archaeon]